METVMALKGKEKTKMQDAMLVAGTIRAASEVYKVAKPIVKAGVKKVKSVIKKRKAKKLEKKKKKQVIKQHNNTYIEGK